MKTITDEKQIFSLQGVLHSCKKARAR